MRKKKKNDIRSDHVVTSPSDGIKHAVNGVSHDQIPSGTAKVEMFSQSCEGFCYFCDPCELQLIFFIEFCMIRGVNVHVNDSVDNLLK